MKPSELRDKTEEELIALEGELRDKLLRLKVAQATQRVTNTAQFSRIKKDIARIKTILHERLPGASEVGAAAAGEEA